MRARRGSGGLLRAARAAALAALTFGAARSAEAQLFLTGANLTAPDGAGNFSGTYWNTLGNDFWFNLYFRQGGTFLNSGNGAGASINIPLVVGTNTFDLFAQPGSLQSWAMNLFFNPGQTLGISVKGTVGSSAFTANAAPCTSDVAHTVCLPGSNSLSYTSGPYTATLTAVQWNAPTADVVQSANNVPGGGLDYAGTLTLTVVGPQSNVPEPATLALLGTGLAAVAGVAARRRGRA
jgi:hypothetical protein